MKTSLLKKPKALMLKWIVSFIVKGYKPYSVQGSTIYLEKPGSPDIAANTHKSVTIQFYYSAVFVMKTTLCVNCTLCLY